MVSRTPTHRAIATALLLATGAATAVAANNAPRVANIAVTVDVAQHQVILQYTLQDDESDPCEVTALLSSNNGLTYHFSTTGVRGDLGYPITPGPNKLIVWDYDPATVDLRTTSPQDFRVRLVADDRVSLSVADLVAQVDPDRLRTDLESIVGVRHITANPARLQATRDLIIDRFTDHGLHVRQQTFASGINLIGRLAGTEEDAVTYILDAHYDTVAGSPGADDNGSGVVGMLEALRILAPYAPQRSFEYIAFDREEAGLLGSTAYVNQGRIPNVQIAGVLNLDMIGYYSNVPNSQTLLDGFELAFAEQQASVAADQYRGNFLLFLANTPADLLRQTFVAASAAYVPALRLVHVTVPPSFESIPDLRRSDHVPFWDEGISACQLNDTGDLRNPNYHNANDTVATLDFNFMANVVRATVASLIDVGGVRHATATESPLVVANGSAPTITAIGNRSIATGGTTGAIPVTLSDTDTPVGGLALIGESSNPTLVPRGSIVFSGTGASRTVTVTPVGTQTGTAEVTVTVSDGALGNSVSFVVTVGSSPVPNPPAQVDRANVTATGFTVQWAGVTGATGYRIDVATDAAFTSFLPGHQNLDVGNVTSLAVSGLGTGTYHVRVRAYEGATTSASSGPLMIGVGGRVLNLSARGRTAGGDGVLIAGFVVRGGGTKPLLIRAAGPTLLTLFSLPGVPDTRLALFDGATPPNVISPGNDDWNGSDAALLQAMAAVNAFPFDPGSKDSAMLVNLPQGLYSVHAQPVDNSTGLTLLELYELDGTAELVNISARAYVGAGNDVLIPGTYLGTAARRLLVRAIGETLANDFNVPGVLADPVIEVHEVEGTANPLFSNDDWSDAANAAQIEAAAAAVLAFPLPAGSKDAAILADLPATGFTFVISGKGSSGVVLFEVYVVP